MHGYRRPGTGTDRSAEQHNGVEVSDAEAAFWELLVRSIPDRRVNSPPTPRSPYPAVAPMHPMTPHPHRASVGTNEPTSWLPNPTSMPDPVTRSEERRCRERV